MSMLSSRMARVGAAAVIASVALVGCTSVVSGTGTTAAGRSSGGGVPDFPTLSVPVPTGTPSVPAGSTSSTPSSGGVLVTYAAGHLRARFPSQPKERTDSGSIDGIDFVTHTASAPSPVTLAAAEDISQPQPESSYEANLRSAITGFASSSGFTLESQMPTTFQGHVAQVGSLSSPSGAPYTLLTFFYTSSRMYMLFTASGGPFAAFTGSFVALA